ncbi:MAG: hypothetical protein Q9M94_03185 [Candidatus Gracilibacteria bacterium]|nr:hypothetical protein [Candidatus Gracilibacteria bacterium]
MKEYSYERLKNISILILNKLIVDNIGGDKNERELVKYYYFKKINPNLIRVEKTESGHKIIY